MFGILRKKEEYLDWDKYSKRVDQINDKRFKMNCFNKSVKALKEQYGI